MSTETALLEPRLVSKIKDKFWVPAYQRGYRWGEVDVRRLLDDVRDSAGDAYYLQPVVVKPRPDGSWELIDGQQRLTTLYLVLKKLGDYIANVSPAFTLDYETRPGTAAYLDELDEESSGDNIDFFHIYQAASTLTAWLSEQEDPPEAAIDLYKALARRVQVIWYEAPASVDSTELFTRLNLGRIPLTDAELIKALVLSRVRTTREDRLIEVAAQWDSVERDLRAPEAWAFISGKDEEQSSHIDLVLDALAGIRRDRTTPAYATFEKLRPAIEADPIEFWNEVLGVHAQILGWYDDLELYHRIGYLVARGWPLGQVLELAQGVTRSRFRENLLVEIRKDLNVTADALSGLSYSSGSGSKAMRALLLMNVESAMRAGTRFSFSAHAAGTWSLEHIHAQNAEVLTTEAQWREWLRLALEALSAMPYPETRAAAHEIAEDVPPPEVPMKGVSFEALEARVLESMAQHGQDMLEDVHSIDNLALLSGSMNTALSNSPFAVKRRELLARDKQGEYIPMCTRNVFLKYYTPTEDQQLHIWSPADREHYMRAMEDVLQPYLTTGSADA